MILHDWCDAAEAISLQSSAGRVRPDVGAATERA